VDPSHPHPYSAYFSASAPAVESSSHGAANFRALLDERPPTTNYLRPRERAELVRKSRKLTQLFGETPSPLSGPSLRSAGRVFDGALPSWTGLHLPRPSWAFRPGAQSVDSFDAVRSHSTPASPVDTLWAAELSLAGAGEELGMGRGKTRDRVAKVAEVTDSASFIDLSDDDHSSSVRVRSPHPIPSPPLSHLSHSPEFRLQTRSPEEDRRRRREKMAKLHRFLGSRIPTSLVLGTSDEDDALPALDPTLGNIRARLPGRRRSSSAAELKSNWFNEGDRVKEELDEREKAINVRRAVKMEKVIRHCTPFSAENSSS
jgi:hypothetical protein